MRADLHAHTTASDGTLTPAELVQHAAATGLTVLALTDHDTTGGWAPAAAALPPGLTLLPGAELSCRAARPGGGWVSVHLLAYLFDPVEPGLAGVRRRLRADRQQRGARMVALLTEAGYPVTMEQVRAFAPGGVVGRPHLARALVEAGLVPSLDAAFTDDWIGTGGRFWVSRGELNVIEAIDRVHHAGGVAVLAHPFAGARGPTVADDAVRAMAAAGLDGIEVDHPDHAPAERDRAARLAADLALLPLGSSDFHGAGRPQPLGARLTSADVVDALVARATLPPVRATGGSMP